MLYVVIILFVVFSGVLAVVAFENFTMQVQITIFAWQSPNFPLGLLLLLAFVLGAVLLYLVAAASAWSDWRELRLLRRRNGELEASLNARAAAQTPSPAPDIPAAQPTQAAPIIPETSGVQAASNTPNGQNAQNAPNSPIPPTGPVVPMPGMPAKPDISDMPTQH